MSLHQIDRALCGVGALVSFGLALAFVEDWSGGVSAIGPLLLIAGLAAAPFVLAYRLLMRTPYRRGLAVVILVTLLSSMAFAAYTYLAPPPPWGRDGMQFIAVPIQQGMLIGLSAFALEILHVVKARFA